ncbi:hypothetical protein JOC37_002201 [Desulfohalotomaculum tongense]|uniref:RuvA C-terminal domain-containing protein n=1 Tax=Desulforadius tongensis TaxID=1216062 RepID=UPI00195A472A|nr:RuvA C-terminal domain-containing protein [Desulforadius tongensis]MBM7855786.1 hypothetical protein [Desulforadius tongensis]
MKNDIKRIASSVMIMFFVIAMLIPVTAFATTNKIFGGNEVEAAVSGTRLIQSVNKIKVLGNYNYITDLYSDKVQLMPVQKNFISQAYGYADKDGNIKIPIHENWSFADMFIGGLAIVFDENKNTLSAIDTNGNVVFDFDDKTYLGGVGDTSYLQRFENDPNGMYCVYVRGNGDCNYAPNNLTLTIYDRQGNRIRKALPYDRIGRFNNGIANLYIITGSQEIPWLEGTTMTKYTYRPIGSINTKGEILDKVVPEVEDEMTDDYGFTVEFGDNNQRIIKNSKGEEIYRYTQQEYKLGSEHNIINQNAILVPVRKDDGTTALTLMDSNGNLYPEYEFNDFNAWGAYGNRFIARPYVSYADKLAYANTLGEEGKQWILDTQFLAEGKDVIMYQLQPPTIYEIQLVGYSNKDNIETVNNTVTNISTSIVPADPNKKLKSGITLWEAKVLIKDNRENLKSLGYSEEDIKQVEEGLYRDLGTTAEEIARCPDRPQVPVTTQKPSQPKPEVEQPVQQPTQQPVVQQPAGSYLPPSVDKDRNGRVDALEERMFEGEFTTESDPNFNLSTDFPESN